MTEFRDPADDKLEFNIRICLNCGHRYWEHLEKEHLVEELQDAPYTCIAIKEGKSCGCRDFKSEGESNEL
jgi:hypothetical protein